MAKVNQQHIIALAGVFQSVRLVETLAKDGSAPADQLETMVNSLFVQNPSSTIEVFGSTEQLSLGFSSMREIFTLDATFKQTDTLNYLVNLNYLAGKLRRTPSMLDHVSTRINEISRQKEHFSILHSSVISSLADLYLETISTFGRRIQVNGFAHNLQQPQIAEKIRCLLFAGIRSSILWHQLGGRKRHLVLSRRDIVLQLKKMDV